MDAFSNWLYRRTCLADPGVGLYNGEHATDTPVFFPVGHRLFIIRFRPYSSMTTASCVVLLLEDWAIFLLRWPRTGWQSVISQGKIPWNTPPQPREWNPGHREDSEIHSLTHWAIMTCSGCYNYIIIHIHYYHCCGLPDVRLMWNNTLWLHQI